MEKHFSINGKKTYQGRHWKGHRIEGLLFNSRMVQGIFDDLNPATAGNWKYPDTQKWDPGRNTQEFIDAMDSWYAHGLLSFTINMQGGSPVGYGNSDWYNSAYYEDGRLRPEYMARMKKILDQPMHWAWYRSLDYFTSVKIRHLKDDNAVIRATENVLTGFFPRVIKIS